MLPGYSPQTNSSVLVLCNPKCAELRENAGPFQPKSHLRQTVRMLSALQLERPKPCLAQEPRAEKCKLSVLRSSQCAHLGVHIKNKTVFALPNRQTRA